MCVICKKIDTMPAGAAMAQIEASIKAGTKPEHFKKALDRLLGTEEPEQDVALERDWERANHGEE